MPNKTELFSLKAKVNNFFFNLSKLLSIKWSFCYACQVSNIIIKNIGEQMVEICPQTLRKSHLNKDIKHQPM